MCQITTVGSAGCAMLYRVLAGRTIAPFLCVQCSRKIKEPIMVSTTRMHATSCLLTAQQQYSHEGYSRMRLYSKSLAPTVVIGLVLSNLKNTSLGWKLTVTTMETEFAWAPNQVSLVPPSHALLLAHPSLSCASAPCTCMVAAEHSPRAKRRIRHNRRSLISSRRRAYRAASSST